MRHRRQTHRLGCKTAHRKAMLGNMVTSLLRHGRIVTTVPRAKEARRLADKMITLAKRGDLHARRQAFAVIHDHKVVADLFETWGQRLANRDGGYTRIVRIGPRRGDAAMLSVLEIATDSLSRPGPRRRPKKIVSSGSVIPQVSPGPSVAPGVETSEEGKEAVVPKVAETGTEGNAEPIGEQVTDVDMPVEAGPEDKEEESS